MSAVKRRRFTIGIILTLLAVSVVLLIVYGLGKLVDIWWYHALGYEFYFWQRMLYSYTVFSVVILVFAGLFFFNMRVASRVLPDSVGPANCNQGDLSPYAKLYHWFRAGSLALSIPLALGLAILIAIPLYRHWEMFLFYVSDPLPVLTTRSSARTFPTTCSHFPSTA